MMWILEEAVFASGFSLADAARAAGHRVTSWDDAWWSNQGWPRRVDSPTVFHGSLGNAARIRREVGWHPGAFCDVDAFRCAAWYPTAAAWLLHQSWTLTSARALVEAQPHADAVFVRPDSPLKPFSGRVLQPDAITLAALDYGFYFDDPELPVVVAPVRSVTREWRYVVVHGRVVAGSAYQADGRRALPDDPTGEAWAFAAKVAAKVPAPEAVYALDVCESDGDLHLLELNPFSGADLYACDAAAVVEAVAAVVEAKA